MDPDADMKTTAIPIACTLTGKEARGQILEWGDLRARSREISSVAGGVQMIFPSSMIDEVEGLARRERACCSFLDIWTDVRGDLLTLQITSDDPEALDVINDVAGVV